MLLQIIKIFTCALLLVAFAACENANAPIDAATRKTIDSLSVAGIRDARIEIDSQCRREKDRRLPIIVDSLRQKRLEEIAEKLKGIPQ